MVLGARRLIPLFGMPSFLPRHGGLLLIRAHLWGFVFCAASLDSYHRELAAESFFLELVGP